MADVVVVGGGVIGCAVAYYLAQAGARVTLIERGEIGGEASGAAAGMLAPLGESPQPGPFLDLCLASFRLYPSLADALRDETDIDIEYLPSGILHVALTDDEERELRHRLEWQSTLGGGLPLEWVDGEALRLLEPRLAPARGALYSPQEHQVSAGRLTQALAQAAARRGTVLRQGAPVTGLLTNRRRVIGARTPSEKTLGDHVVLAAGPWMGAFARRLGVPLPVRPVRGQMLAFADFALPLRHIVWGEAAYLVPKANGFLFVGATVEDVGFRSTTTVQTQRRLRRGARELVPSLAYSEVASSWAGLRPASADGLPILGAVPGWDGLSVAAGHYRNGILLAPITGRLMAQLITEGKTEVSLAPFSAGRFENSG
jgi:glycine oxidase